MKRVLTLFLTLALCLGLALPAAAADQQIIMVGDETYEHLLQSMLSQEEDQPMTVVLGSDVQLTATVVVGSSDYDGLFAEPQTVASHDVTIDLNGYTLSGPADAALLVVQDGYTLTIVDSSAAKTGQVVSQIDEGVVVEEGGTYNALPAAEEETGYTVADGVASVTTMAGLAAAAADADVESILVAADLRVTEDMETDKPLVVGEGVSFTIASDVKVVASAAMGGFGYEDLDSQDGANMERMSASGIQFLLSAEGGSVYRELYGSLSDAVAALSDRSWTTVSLTGNVVLDTDVTVSNLSVFGSLTLAEGAILTVDEGYVTGDITLNGQELPENLTCGGEAGQAPANPFTDVAESNYFYEPVLWAVEQGITTGRTETTFVPNDTCTEANILTFLWRANGEPAAETTENPFGAAVSADSYYYSAALWAFEQGMIDETFAPNTACTRAQAVYFMWVAAGSPDDAAASSFTDVAADASYADAVNWAVAQGVTTGRTETTFAPADTCTRGNIVTFLYRDLAE